MDLVRTGGYGNGLHRLTVNGDGTLSKTVRDGRNSSKLRDEIRFYQHLIDNNISFPTPKILKLSLSLNIIKMQYLPSYTTLYELIKQQHLDINLLSILDKVKSGLSTLHKHGYSSSQGVDKRQLLRRETTDKIRDRFRPIRNIVSSKMPVSVNGVKLYPVDIVFDYIEQYVDRVKLDNRPLTLIHGDPNFHNILVGPSGDLVFIDPKASFGGLPLYGLPEYDWAKIAFALTGYDEFDEMNPSVLIFDANGDLKIPIKPSMSLDEILQDPFIAFICSTIWLSNAHGFVDNQVKCQMSFYYGLYIFAVYYNIHESK